MNIFGGIFGGKKDDADTNTSHNQSIDESQQRQGAPAQSGGNANVFGDFVQFKRKPSGSVNKPKGFDPFAMPGSKPATNEPHSLSGQDYDQAAENRSMSGHGSLSRLDEGDTPKASGDSLTDVGKKSAFGFIQKKPIKTPEAQPSQNLSFVSNVNVAIPEQTEFENTAERNNPLVMGERRKSISLSSEPEPANPPAPTKSSAFSFIKKKTNAGNAEQEPQQNTLNQSALNKDISLTLDTSQQDLGSARASSDTKSDTADIKNVTTPPASGSHIKFGKSPGSVHSSRQSEADTNMQTFETRSDYQTDRVNLRVPETNPVKPSGPSFGKFKKTEPPKVQIGETLSKPKAGSPGTGGRVLGNKNDSPTKESTRPVKTRSEPERIFQTDTIKAERIITSPLQAIQTPAVHDQETPEGVQSRLEREKNDILENIGELVSRQNGLMGKKSSLEAQRDNVSKKLKLVANQQNEAIENDNFEEADHLEVVIIELNESMRDLEKQIDNCQLEYTDLEREKQLLYQNEALVFKKYVGEIEELLLTQNYSYEKYKLDCQSQQNTEKAYIEEKTKELQYIRNHIELDLKHINEESNQVQETLNKHIKDYVVERDDLSKRKDDLEDLIEQIKKQLQEKEEELVGVTGKLGKVTAKITTITSKFDDQLLKIKRRRDKVTDEDEKYHAEVTKLNQHKETVENSIKRLDEVSQNYAAMLENYKSLVAQFTEESSKLDKDNTRREKAIKLYYESLNELRQEKHQLLNCEEEIDKLKDELSRVQKETNSTFAQKNTLANKIPGLEKEKKEFVASRSFKDASRISNEIKDIQTKITEIEEKLTQLSEDEKQTVQKINTLERETIPSLRERVNTTSRECNLNKYELLKVKEDDLALIHTHYLGQKLYKEASSVESELKTAQKQLAELLNEHPELQKREVAFNDQKEKERQAREEQELKARSEKERQEAEAKQASQEAISQNNVEPVIQSTPQNEIEETVTQVEPKKEIPLGDLVAEYDENKINIEKMEAEIDRLASEELYAEAEEVSEQQSKLNKRQEEIIEDISRLGFGDIEEARASLNKPEEEPQQEVVAHEEEPQQEAVAHEEEPQQEAVAEEENNENKEDEPEKDLNTLIENDDEQKDNQELLDQNDNVEIIEANNEDANNEEANNQEANNQEVDHQEESTV